MHQAGLIPVKKAAKVLDGVLLMHSCRVRNPFQAIRSKLSNQGIIEVREEDLIYFKNLTHLDLSDNQVSMNQFKNLVALEELDLQYNDLTFIQIQQGYFLKLSNLKISFNQISPEHIAELAKLPNLRSLEMAANELSTLPANLSFLNNL